LDQTFRVADFNVAVIDYLGIGIKVNGNQHIKGACVFVGIQENYNIFVA
jgi:hypothetical protein